MSDPKWGLSSLSNLVIQTYRARWPRTTFKSSTTLDWKIGEDASFRWRGHVHPHPALVVRASVRTIVSTCPNPRRKGDRANSPHHPQVLGKATGSETISCQVEAHDILDETWKTDQGDDQGWGENPLQDKAADLEASEVETRTGHLERRWEGNPYLQMLSSPLRKCLVTSKVLPRELMIHLKPVFVPTELGYKPPNAKAKLKKFDIDHQMDQVLLPDQILHPRYSIRKPGQGLWLTANRKILEELSNSQSHRKVAPKATIPENLCELVEKQLRRRVVQEVDQMVSRINCRVPLTIVDDHSKCPRKESRNQEIQRFETTDHLDSFLLKAVGGDEEMVSSGVNLTLLDFHQENVGESDRPEGGVESESMTPEEGRGFGFGEIRRLDGGDRIKIHHYRMRTKGAFQEGEAEEIRRLLSSVFEVLRGGENKKTRRRREWLMKRKSVKETSQSRIQRGGGSGWEGEGKIDSSSDRKKEESKEAEGGSDHDGQGHRYFLLGQSPQTVGTCVALLRLKNWSV